MGIMIVFDYGNIEIMGLEAEVFGTPGQERFDFVFQIFAREVNGLLLVIDRTRAEDLPRARQMKELAGKDIPTVVLANKADLPNPLADAEIRTQLGIGPEVPIVSTVATQGQGLTEALQKLASMILGEG